VLCILREHARMMCWGRTSFRAVLVLPIISGNNLNATIEKLHKRGLLTHGIHFEEKNCEIQCQKTLF
jgi:hypothetical protein